MEAIEILKWKEKSQVWKMENFFFFSSSIKLPISSQDSTEDLPWYLPGVAWNLFSHCSQGTDKMMSQKGTTQEVYSLWLWPAFLKTDSEERVSFKMPERKSNLAWLLWPKGFGVGGGSWPEPEVGGIWIEYEGTVVRQWNRPLKTQNQPQQACAGKTG